REHAVLVQRHELAQRFRRQSLGHNRARGTITLEDAMRHEPVGRALGLDLLRRLAEGERLALGEDVGDEHVVMASERIERLVKRDEVARDELRALMYQLVKRMLSIGAGLAPEDGTGLVVHGRAVERDMLAVGFHRELLEIGREALEVLL